MHVHVVGMCSMWRCAGTCACKVQSSSKVDIYITASYAYVCNPITKLTLDQTCKTCNPSVPIGTWGADPRISQLGGFVSPPPHIYRMCRQPNLGSKAYIVDGHMPSLTSISSMSTECKVQGQGVSVVGEAISATCSSKPAGTSLPGRVLKPYKGLHPLAAAVILQRMQGQSPRWGGPRRCPHT